MVVEKQLLEMISFQIQLTKPDNVPKPPFTTTASSQPQTTPTSLPSKSSTKGKQPAFKTAGKSSASTTNSSSSHAQIQPQQQSKAAGRRLLPVPPEPQPPLTSRVSPYSPALVSGVLVETVKAGMNATEGGGAGAAGGGMGGIGGGGMGGRGKRKVVRVRG